jgi:hypothetical protein
VAACCEQHRPAINERKRRRVRINRVHHRPKGEQLLLGSSFPQHFFSAVVAIRFWIKQHERVHRKRVRLHCLASLLSFRSEKLKTNCETKKLQFPSLARSPCLMLENELTSGMQRGLNPPHSNAFLCKLNINSSYTPQAALRQM